MEYEDDFKEYVSVPHFSYKIIQTLYDLTNSSGTENFAYVYSTYSSLKTSNETKDPKEMVTALLDAEKRTKQLVESLTAVFHDIKYYNQLLVNEASVNQVLLDHFSKYQNDVVEKILLPLKVRDSVPKYKLPIKNILQSWLVYPDTMELMVRYLQKTNGGERSILAAVLGVFIVLIKFVHIEEYPIVSLAAVVFSIIMILRFAPLEHENKPITEKGKTRLRKNSIVLALISSVSVMVLFILDFRLIMVCVSFGMLTASGSMLAAVIEKKSKEMHLGTQK